MKRNEVAENNRDNASCTFCGAAIQRISGDADAIDSLAYYECSTCGCLLKKYHGNAGIIEYTPKNHTICRDTFLCFSTTKKISELLDSPGVCVISSQNNTGFLTRMLLDHGIETIPLRYVEKNSFIGVELNDYTYRTIAKDDLIEGKIIVVLGTLASLRQPQSFFESVAKFQPQCIVFVSDIYQGQDLSWSVLLGGQAHDKIFYSYQALAEIAQKIHYRLSTSERICVLNRRDKETELGTLASVLQNIKNDFSEYQLAVKKKDIEAENLAKSDVTRDIRRIFLSAPVSNLLYIDCVFYQDASSGIARLWNEVFKVWAQKYSDRVVLLDRGGDIQDFGLQRIPFKRFDFNSIPSEIRALSWYLLRRGAYRFASTYYTFSELLPTRALVYDMIPENLSYDKNAPPWFLKGLYLDRAESVLTISRQTMTDLIKYYPQFEGKTQYSYPTISQIFKPINKKEKSDFRSKIGVTRKYLFTVPCGLGGYKDGITALKAIDGLDIAKDSEVMCTVPLFGQEKLIEPLKNIKIRSLRFSDQDYASLIAASDMVIWTPLMEGLGLPPMEAVACNTNIVVSRTAINQELYGDTVTYAEPLNVDSFSHAIESALARGINSDLVARIKSYRSMDDFADKLFNLLYS
jgi:hypothetical protein